MATNKEINTKLKQITERYRSEYARIAEKSWQDYVNTLPSGQAVPPKGTIYGEEARESFNGFCNGLRAEASDLIGKARMEVKDKMLEAPSEDAVNVVNMLKLHQNATREEIGDILGKYGDNYMVSKTISSIASERGINGMAGASEMLDNRMKELDRVERSYGPAALSVKGAESRNPDAYTEFIDADVDRVFPTE